MTDRSVGDPVTIVDNQRRELPGGRAPDTQAQAQQAAQNQARAASERSNAAAVHTAVAVARAEQQRAQHLGADQRRWGTGFGLLDEQISPRDERGERVARADMRVLSPGNVLLCSSGPESGTPNVESVREFVARVLNGELPYDVLESMHAARMERALSGAVQHADAMYRRADGLEHAATVQPALPAGPVSSNGVPLPRREQPAQAIAPSQPPMYPPAPPEPMPTGELVRVVEEAAANGRLAPQTVKALHDGGFGQPAEPGLAVDAADPRFSAAAVPSARSLEPQMGDTQRFSLTELDADLPPELLADGPAEDDEQDGRLVPPFALAATEAAGAKSTSPTASGGGDGNA